MVSSTGWANQQRRRARQSDPTEQLMYKAKLQCDAALWQCYDVDLPDTFDKLSDCILHLETTLKTLRREYYKAQGKGADLGDVIRAKILLKTLRKQTIDLSDECTPLIQEIELNYRP